MKKYNLRVQFDTQHGSMVYRMTYGLFSDGCGMLEIIPKGKLIPRLLNTVWHDFVTEEFWNVIKKHKNPRVDFKLLNTYVVKKIKELKPELF